MRWELGPISSRKRSQSKWGPVTVKGRILTKRGGDFNVQSQSTVPFCSLDLCVCDLLTIHCPFPVPSFLLNIVPDWNLGQSPEEAFCLFFSQDIFQVILRWDTCYGLSIVTRARPLSHEPEGSEADSGSFWWHRVGWLAPMDLLYYLKAPSGRQSGSYKLLLPLWT